MPQNGRPRFCPRSLEVSLRNTSSRKRTVESGISTSLTEEANEERRRRSNRLIPMFLVVSFSHYSIHSCTDYWPFALIQPPTVIPPRLDKCVSSASLGKMTVGDFCLTVRKVKGWSNGWPVGFLVLIFERLLICSFKRDLCENHRFCVILCVQEDGYLKWWFIDSWARVTIPPRPPWTGECGWGQLHRRAPK